MDQIRVSTFAGPGAQPVLILFRGQRFRAKRHSSRSAPAASGTDLHILKGHWPKQLPWPFTLGHELGGVLDPKSATNSNGFRRSRCG